MKRSRTNRLPSIFVRSAFPLLCFVSCLLFSQARAQPSPGASGLRNRLKAEVERTDYFAAMAPDSPASGNAAGKPASGKWIDSAIHHSDLAMDLADSLTDRKTLAQLYLQRSTLENRRGGYEQAHNFYISSWNISDSLNSQQRKNEIAELQGRHDLETREKEIAMHNLQARVQQRTLAGLIGGLLLLCVIALLILRQSRRRRKTNSTLLVLNNQLGEANKVKARFFGILSHDLRSPVASLLGFLQQVKGEPDRFSPAEKMQQQQEISRSAENLLETMEAMLLWSKEQMQSFKPDLREIAVAELFGYLEKFFGRPQHTQLGFSNPERLRIRGDENYLRVIMQNLTSNAIRALNGQPGGVIRWEAFTKEGQTLLTLTDNGPGMSSDKAAALFTASEGVNARSGFGFHLIRDLAAAIRLGISIEPQTGGGTRFLLRPSAIREKSAVPA